MFLLFVRPMRAVTFAASGSAAKSFPPTACRPRPGSVFSVPSPPAAQTATQSWPQRSVKFILPFGAGSATDAAARMMSDKLSARWGKPIVIENKPGADGLLAIGAFVSANDDHVLLYASSASFNTHPYMHEKLPYNLERDLAPIARVTDTIGSASVPVSLKATTIAEFVALARAEPNKLNAAGAAGVPDFQLGVLSQNREPGP